MSELNPIFVHASPRSGSTYFFNVLRRNVSLMCFNEAIIDVFSHYGPRDMARFGAASRWNVNHHFLNGGEYDEFVEAWHAAMHLYPPFLSFQNYLPLNGVLSSDIRAYLSALMQYARSRDKRPALCEIHSRGRTGALRGAFGGYHIAQYRDPLSQFGSFFRPLAEGGEWGFLAFPLMELGISGTHPLYRLVPEGWRVEVLPWPADDRARRWASAVQYMAMVASPGADAIERLLRWHLFSWTLSNLASVCYSDFVLDIDKTHDDAAYRRTVVDTIATECGAVLDFNDLTKFPRYYEFEGLNVKMVCNEVVRAMREAVTDGRAEKAVRALGTAAPLVSAASAAELLLTKIEKSIASMEAAGERQTISAAEWKTLVEKHRRPWFNSNFRVVAQHFYPMASPIVRAARRVRMWMA